MIAQQEAECEWAWPAWVSRLLCLSSGDPTNGHSTPQAQRQAGTNSDDRRSEAAGDTDSEEQTNGSSLRSQLIKRPQRQVMHADAR